MPNDPEVSNWHVLIVDDDEDSLGVAQQFLSFIGANVSTATRGADVLKILEDTTPTFILLDLSMPDMDGWEVFEKIRSNPKTADLTVIALTAHAMVHDKERVTAAGFDGYITKPYVLTAMLAEVKRILSEKKGQPEAAPQAEAKEQAGTPQDSSTTPSGTPTTAPAVPVEPSPPAPTAPLTAPSSNEMTHERP